MKTHTLRLLAVSSLLALLGQSATQATNTHPTSAPPEVKETWGGPAFSGERPPSCRFTPGHAKPEQPGVWCGRSA